MLDSEPQAPSLHALVATTLALMTRWAEPQPQACPEQLRRMRSLLARKIVSNLFFLQHHPAAPPALRQVVANVHHCWQAMVQQAQGDAATATAAAPMSPPARPKGGTLH